MSDLAPLLLFLLFWFFAIGKGVSKSKKKQEDSKKAGSPGAAAPKQPSRARTSFPKEAFPESPAPDAAPVQPIKAADPDAARTWTERTPLAPTITVPSFSDSPRDAAGDPYLGSLGENTLEGVDPCHDDQMAEMEQRRGASAAAGAEAPDRESFLSWSGNDVVRGFIYGEILNRRKRA